LDPQFYDSLFKAEFEKLMQRYQTISETLERYPTLKEEYDERVRRLGRLLTS
jgi:hypothetical protein